MASHPYISGAGNIAQMVGFLRKNFPARVTSDTVKKFGIAPKNESYVINALQFVGVIDGEGKRTEVGHNVFVLGDDEFPGAFEELIRDAYKDLFELRGNDAWALTKNELTSYFRTADKTSEAIGGRQASVFCVFRGLAGHEQEGDKSLLGSMKAAPATKSKPTTVKKTSAPLADTTAKASSKVDSKESRKSLALTVRIEINLPANGTQETYDAIFKSIKANLIND